MQTTKISLDRKLFLKKNTVAKLSSTQTDVVEGPVAVSAPYRTAFSTAETPMRCYPCCKEPILTFGGTCRN
ncbi:class I lanthipeptide [Chitinophaga solisilvae]|uniref:Class I lanthipeptide n=1 Tax=Chitinophaga solisilvae TaxID=1233460 RepID=A0A9Q5D4N8_9BACT|nr:class I lanthipeptide [Chitinophaga solisilvae]NSL90943.1 hypothetical protein [Chitinophaga solisilvae]